MSVVIPITSVPRRFMSPIDAPVRCKSLVAVLTKLTGIDTEAVSNELAAEVLFDCHKAQVFL
jgi:hypothetical protein